MPFTANRQFKAAPRMIVGAEGMYYRTDDGRQLLDGAAGLWCCNAGHARPRIVEAIQKQAAELDYAPAFQMGHPKAFTLAARLARMMPGDLDHVFLHQFRFGVGGDGAEDRAGLSPHPGRRRARAADRAGERAITASISAA